MNHPDQLKAAAPPGVSELGIGASRVQSAPILEPDGSDGSGRTAIGRADSFLTGVGLDPALTELAEEITQRLQAGEPVDIDDYAARYAEWAEVLRRLMPVLRGMAEMGRAAVQGGLEGDGGQAAGGGACAGRVLGDFRILREVGRGGMGVVYEAEQISLGRRVALKVLPLAAAMDPRALQRFQLEAQAAAFLQHSRIVPVHAVGALGDVPYYAMQFIEGASLAELVAELRRHTGLGSEDLTRADRAECVSSLARGLVSGRLVPQDPDDASGRRDQWSDHDAPKPPPSAGGAPPVQAIRLGVDPSALGRDYPRTVAHLVMQAAEALEYAHCQGILHRDVKPANLLLDQRGVLWVTDFGLARIAGDGGLTLSGDVLGTLRYMSPEQAMARRALIDRRTDIYSLGATLYELLTLQPPVPGSDRQEILRHIIEDDPPPISRLNPAVLVDLRTVVAKAMCKDPLGRYDTAQHFADDLRRFLEGRAIAARPIGPLRRAWRWCRRRPLPAGLAAGLVLASVAGIVGVTLSWRDAVRANKALLIANAHERSSLVQSQRRFALAREAVEQYYTGASQDVLLRQPQMESLRKRLLGTALSFYKRLQATIEEGPAEPKTRVELASVYRRVGQIAVEVGSRREGLEALQQARAILEDLVKAEPAGLDRRRELASCLEFIGRLQVYTSGMHAEGMRSLQRALELYEGLSAVHADDPLDLFAMASTIGGIGTERARTGRTGEGLAQLERAGGILEKLVAKYPDNAVYRNQLALNYGELGTVQGDAGRLADALHSEEEAARHLERLAAAEPATAVYRRRLGQVETDLGRVLCEAGRPEEALRHSERGLAILERVADEVPAVDSYQRAVAECYDVVGQAMARTGRHDEALRALGRARSTLQRLIAGHPDFVAYQADLAENYLWTGAAYQDQGRSAEALVELRKARELLGRMEPETGNLYDLARTESRLVPLSGPGERGARADRAISALRRAVAHGYRSLLVLETDPCLDPLRARPDFQLLLLDLAFPDDPFAP